jgi:anthranilate phosphoribosyltransferase
VEAILNGEPGARRDVVVLNAGAALQVAGLVDSLVDGVDRAALTIDAGLAGDLLAQLRAQRRTAEAAAAATAQAAETPA